MASPIAPEPVPRSATVTGEPHVLASAIAVSATSSVSGRGISTRESTARSSRRKPHRPSTYCNGSPVRSRSSMESR